MSAPDKARPVTVGQIAAELGGEVLGNASQPVQRIAPLTEADVDAIAFLSSARLRSQLESSAAGCVIVAPALREAVEARPSAILVDDPYLYFARLTQWWRRHLAPTRTPTGIHPTAVIGSGVRIGAGVSLGPFAVIGDGAELADGVVLGPHVVIGDRVSVGAGTRLAAGVQVGDDCRVGARGIVHGRAVIGADGFGFAPHAGAWEKIEQLGAVRIGDDVEIGAGTCIDRGALSDTVIEDGVKLDNLIQIAHNVHIGAHTAMAAFAGVAGSARIGRHCMIGGAAGIAGHIEICDHVQVSAFTLVSRSIRKPGHYAGAFPFDESANWEKNAATLRQLHAMRDRLRTLEKMIKPC